MEYLLGIDIGTSSAKVLLMSGQGEVVRIAQHFYDISIPSIGFAEQHPDTWWEAVVNSIREVIKESNIEAEKIKGVGLSGQMHGLVMLGQNNDVIHPCIIWADQRSRSQVEYIRNAIGMENLPEVTLNSISTGFLAPSLLWIKQNKPEIFKNVYRVVLPKDYIRMRLTGKIATDITDASGTLFYDIPNHNWNEWLLDLMKIDKDIMPEVFLPYEISGEITKEASFETGLKIGTPVVYGCADQPAQALGNGIIEEGMVSITIGTGGQVFSPVKTPVYDKALRTHTFCHVEKNMWNVMGATLSAGLSYKWLRSNFFSDFSYKDLDNFAAKICPGSEGLMFLPYLSGERTPHMDPDAKAVFYGINLVHTNNHFIRSVLEGIVFSLKECACLLEDLGLSVDKVIASGGGADSNLLKQIMADILEKDIYTSNSKEQACIGAAMLAGIGVGIYGGIKDAVDKVVTYKSECISPNTKNFSVYREAYDKYKRLYKSIKEI